MVAVPLSGARPRRVMAGEPDVQAPGFRPGELFEGLGEGEFACVRNCLRAEVLVAERGERVLEHRPGRPKIGVLISGTGLDTEFRVDGSSSLIDVIEPGDLFGDGWDILDEDADRAIVAASEIRAIVLDSGRLVDGYSGCSVRPLVVENFLRCALKKQWRLREHFDLVTRRSLRARLSTFLLKTAERTGHRQFTIPLSRAELAEFLHADRAAVSRELARMQDDSLISFHRNSFKLHQLH